VHGHAVSIGPAGSLNKTADITNRYLWGPAVDQILADEQVDWNSGAQNYNIDDILWPLTDHQGTVRDIVELQADGTTKTVQRKSYDANGNVLKIWEPNQYGFLTTIDPENATVTHLFGFTGRPNQTDTGLINCLNRWYDPVIASWTTQDPITFQGGDANLYRYCGNDPVNSVNKFRDGDIRDDRVTRGDYSPSGSHRSGRARIRASGSSKP